VIHNNFEVTQSLIEEGADTNVKDNSGRTPEALARELKRVGK